MKKNKVIKKSKSMKKNKAMRNEILRSKRGLSEIIAYVLLIAIAVFMSILVYRWIKTYVPKEIATCPDSTSISIKSVSYNCVSKVLNITLKNNGRFSLDGYLIRATTSSDPNALANLDLASKLIENLSTGEISKIFGSSIKFSLQSENYFSPDAISEPQAFNVAGTTLTKIEIIPLRVEVVANKKRVATCNNVKIHEYIKCN